MDDISDEPWCASCAGTFETGHDHECPDYEPSGDSPYPPAH
jgi:hypothetical protein